MAESKHAQFRYKVIDKYLRKKQGVTYRDLMLKLQEFLFVEFGIKSITKRQLEIDLNHIENYFEIEIIRENSLDDARVKILRYKNPEDSIFKKPLNEDEIQILNNIFKEILSFQGRPNSYHIQDIINKINLNVENLENENPIVVYQGNEYLKGIEYFNELYNYIIDKINVKIIYKGFNQSEFEIVLSPYLLKEFNSRWYLYGLCISTSIPKFLENKIINLALDRIEKITSIQSDYIQIDFNPKEYFDDFYGVTNSESPIEKVIIHFIGSQGFYIETNPIHHSQKGKWISEEIYEVSLKLKINFEFITKLNSYIPNIKIISPLSLKQKIVEIALKNIDNYKN